MGLLEDRVNAYAFEVSNVGGHGNLPGIHCKAKSFANGNHCIYVQLTVGLPARTVVK